MTALPPGQRFSLAGGRERRPDPVPGLPPLHRVLDALEASGFNPRREGRGWKSRCPAHADRRPSLRVYAAQDGLVLLHCFAGCETGAVLAALGLELRDLYEPDPFRAAMRHTPRCPAIRSDPSRPPAQEVRRMWHASVPVHEDPEAAAWLESRGLDPLLIADRDLVRVLPARVALPSWARCSGRSWADSGHRVIVPMFDCRGEFVSLHARATRPDAEAAKGLSPAGHAVRGLVFADDAGQAMLRRTVGAGCVWIAEGMADFLDVAIAWGADSDVATLAVIAGSWRADLAARIPDGSRVVIATDHDQAGVEYAHAIARTVAGRVTLLRWSPPREAAS